MKVVGHFLTKKKNGKGQKHQIGQMRSQPAERGIVGLRPPVATPVTAHSRLICYTENDFRRATTHDLHVLHKTVRITMQFI